MWEFLSRLFDTSDFPPRWHCGNWTTGHGVLHIVSDTAIFAAYLAIPFLMFYAVRRRGDVRPPPVFWLFCAFILLCGMTHGLEALIFWSPVYRFAGVLKAATALVSLSTVVAIVRLLPAILSLKTTEELQAEVERRTEELRISEKRAVSAENRLAATFAQVPTGVAELSADGYFARVNARFASYCATTPEALCGRAAAEAGELGALLAQRISGNEGTTTPVDVMLRSDSETKVLEVTTRRVNGEDEAPHLVAVAHDVTETRNASAQLEAKGAQLAAVNDELEGFNYSVSHDLRAPLRAISGFAKILEEDYGEVLGDDGQRVIGTIVRNATQMNNLIASMLELSRLDRHRLMPEDVALDPLVADVIADCERRYPNAKEIVHIESLPTVRGDTTLLRHALLNMVDNALKYSSKVTSPRVGITCTEGDGEVGITVTDNGAGFDMAFAKNLFTPFQRLHSKEEFEGTGVGLTSVARTIRRHGGRIEAQGEVGKGAQFTIWLPKEK